MLNIIKIFHMVQEIGTVSFLQNSDLGKALAMINDIWQYPGLDHVNINMYAKFDKNIPSGSRVIASFRTHRLIQWTIIVHTPKSRPSLSTDFLRVVQYREI